MVCLFLSYSPVFTHTVVHAVLFSAWDNKFYSDDGLNKINNLWDTHVYCPRKDFTDTLLHLYFILPLSFQADLDQMLLAGILSNATGCCCSVDTYVGTFRCSLVSWRMCPSPVSTKAGSGCRWCYWYYIPGTQKFTFGAKMCVLSQWLAAKTASKEVNCK